MTAPVPRQKIIENHRSGFEVSALAAPWTLGEFANSLNLVPPALAHAVTMLWRDQPHSFVRELEARAAAFGRQSILHVIDRGVRHRHRPADFQQRRRLDDLHMSPEMAG